MLGLKLDQVPTITEIPDQIKQLATERETARQNKDWAKADELRQEIGNQGYVVEDKQTGPEIKPRD